MKIELQDIVKRFGTLEAVSHVSLDIQDGELFTLLGPSGCGKTTILRLIGGFHRADQGRILFGDQGRQPGGTGLDEITPSHHGFEHLCLSSIERG